MVVIIEYRIPLPIDVQEYCIAQLYTVAEESKNNTSGGEGIKVVKNEPFEDERGKGQYTFKIYNVESKLPSLVTAIAPRGSLIFYEHAWNCYPNCRTEYSNEYLGEKFKFSITSRHLPDNGCTENVFELTDDELKKRQVFELNVADKDQLDVSKYDPAKDPALVKSEKCDLLPLQKDFKEKANPVMCCYKLLNFSCTMTLVGGMIERKVHPYIYSFLLEFHRKVMCLVDFWKGMTMEQLREHEVETQKILDEKLKQGAAPPS